MKTYNRIYHYHIPKTGGTSINYSFFSLVGEPKEVYSKINARGSIVIDNKRFTRDNVSQFKSGNFFYGFSHSQFFSLQPDTFKMTCIRNPKDRVLSQYTGLLMRKSEGQHREGFAWLGNSFSDFLDKLPPQHLNSLVRTFSNGNIDTALRNIKSCDYILQMDTLEADINNIGNILKLPLKVYDVNKSTVSYTPTEEEMKKLEAKVNKDILFYDAIKNDK